MFDSGCCDRQCIHEFQANRQKVTRDWKGTSQSWGNRRRDFSGVAKIHFFRRLASWIGWQTRLFSSRERGPRGKSPQSPLGRGASGKQGEARV
jgi:hypothetical protein